MTNNPNDPNKKKKRGIPGKENKSPDESLNSSTERPAEDDESSSPEPATSESRSEILNVEEDKITNAGNSSSPLNEIEKEGV